MMGYHAKVIVMCSLVLCGEKHRMMHKVPLWKSRMVTLVGRDCLRYRNLYMRNTVDHIPGKSANTEGKIHANSILRIKTMT
jgi:hypothetical protein